MADIRATIEVWKNKLGRADSVVFDVNAEVRLIPISLEIITAGVYDPDVSAKPYHQALHQASLFLFGINTLTVASVMAGALLLSTLCKFWTLNRIEQSRIDRR